MCHRGYAFGNAERSTRIPCHLIVRTPPPFDGTCLGADCLRRLPISFVLFLMASPWQYLVRYGVIPEVARCRWAEETPPPRGAEVVVETHRGRQLGTVVQVLPERPSAAPSVEEVHEVAPFTVIRRATPADQQRHAELHAEAQQQFPTWVERIRQWNVDVQLVDLEWTLDRSKLILYVLNERGPECTRLAIQAAAAGLGVIEVQPVSQTGLVSQPAGGGGCGTCGCHS